MEIRVLERGLGSFRTGSPLVSQVLFDTVEGFRLVRCDFPTEQEEREFMEQQTHIPFTDRLDWLRNAGGSGCITLMEDDETGARVEIFGSVRHLAPALRQIADAFEARLAELPS